MLPLDVLVTVLSHLPPQRNYGADENIHTFAYFMLVSNLCYEAACVPSLWKPHYLARYLHSNEEKETQRREKYDGNWRLMYTERRRKDRDALKLLHCMVENPESRYDHARRLWESGFDIWDMLQLEMQQPLPRIFRTDFKEDWGCAHHLALPRLYWTRAVMGTITKGHAFQLWKNHRKSSFVDAFSGISCFFGVTPMHISRILRQLTEDCRGYLGCKKYKLPPNDDYDVAELSIAICDFMTSRGFGPCESDDFHNMDNHFPHSYLFTHRRSIPISLVHVFVALAQGLGIQAHPVSFPARVLATVTPSDPEADKIFVDVYGYATKPILSVIDDMPAMIRRHGIPVESLNQHTSPCGGTEMLLRSSRNILASIHLNGGRAMQTEAFVALSILVIVSGQHSLLPSLLKNTDPIDCATCIPASLGPTLNGFHDDVIGEECHKKLSDEAKILSSVCHRPQNVKLAGFVGMIFIHQRYRYVGCIFAWDTVCEADEEWIVQMRVELLPRGRNQPFYSVYALDGSQRYVAEDNIRPAYNLDREALPAFYENVPSLGKYFTNVQISEGGVRLRFTLGPDLRMQFPDDERAGQNFIVGLD